MKLRLLTLLLATLCCGCGGPEASPAPVDDAGGDITNVEILQGDALEDAGPLTPPWDPPPLAEGDEPEVIEGLQWRLLYVGNKPDPVIGPLLAGTFTWPEEEAYWFRFERLILPVSRPDGSAGLIALCVPCEEIDIPMVQPPAATAAAPAWRNPLDSR